MKSGEFWKGIKAKVMVRQGTLNVMEIWVDKETGCFDNHQGIRNTKKNESSKGTKRKAAIF